MNTLKQAQAKKFVEGYNIAVAYWNSDKPLPGKISLRGYANDGFECVRRYRIHLIINGMLPSEIPMMSEITVDDVKQVRLNEEIRLNAIEKRIYG